MTKTGIIILSAGKSSRLGQPKQLLAFKGKSLIETAVDAALNSNCGPVWVVTGAFQESILPLFCKKPVQIIKNPHWEQGMGTSIAMGIGALVNAGGAEQAIIMLADQPFVDAELLKGMLQAQEKSKKPIIAASYQNRTLGVPALFEQKYFDQLMALKGKEGAKKIIQRHLEQVETISFDRGNIDIDTLSDYEALKKSNWKHFK
ncbi:MAG: nucleotidyltransferase family protein [Cyclobacteriaceae bacterium]